MSGNTCGCLLTLFLLSVGLALFSSASADEWPDEGHYRPDLTDFMVTPEELSEQDKLSRHVARQALSAGQEYLGRNVLQQLAIQHDVSAETTGLLGEQIDLSSGSVSFVQTDIDIPGNFAIPVRLARSWGGPDRWYGANRFFANWNLDLAYISTTMASANEVYFTGSWAQNKACTGSLNPQTSLSKAGAVLVVNDYWNGDSVYIPGQGSTALLTSGSATRTTKNNWRVRCFNSGKGYEGFKVTTPDGLTYTFDQFRMVRGEDLWKAGPVEGPIIPGPIPSPDPGHGPETVSFSRYHTFMLVSRVEDRFGNWVSYSYSGNHLSRIDASDGRAITLQYSNNRVSSASAHGKTWSYSYNTNALTGVSRPDGRSWQFTHSQAAFFDLAPNTEGRCLNNDSRAVPHHLVTITHPTGVVGEFKIKSVRHGRTEVPKLQLGPVHDNNYRYAFAIDRCYNTMALTEKTLRGAGLDPMTWQYSYSENEGAFINESKQAVSVIGGGLPAGLVAGDLKYTRVQAPDNSLTVHYFNRSFNWREGSEVFTDQFDTDGSTRLRRTLHTFVRGSNFGSAAQQYNNADVSSHAVLTTRRHITELGDSYSTDYSAFNAYSTPTLVKESNSLHNQSRWQRTTFYHDTTNWLLNQPARLEYSANNSSWTTVRETSYYGANHSYKSLPHQIHWYGSLISTFNSYHADGNLKQHSYNASNRWVQFENYRRGKARLIKLPQRYTASCSNPASCFISATRVVNDDGTVAQVTDFNGNRTNYQYDGLRRVTRITPADTRWAATTLSYPTEGGRLTQVISQGNYRKKITFDGLLRPTLMQEWDASVSGSSRYTVQRFNAYNHAVFTSFPSTNSTESRGMAFDYDGLQRLIGEYNTVSNRGTSYYYLAGLQKRTENARGYNSYTHYRAWGQPAYELPVRIEDNNSVTSLSYNLFDNLTSISQGGVTENRLYTAQQRLCRVVRPDVGHTAYGYNTLGELVWSAAGASGGATACNGGSVPAAQRLTYSYDNLGELRTLSYADSTPTKVYTLDNQGNLTRLTAGTAIWNYSYNSKHLPETESLSYDSHTFTLGWAYNTLGHISSVSYPGGRQVSFNPNALGQARQAGTFASAASYYPDGQLNQFTFGNSIIRKHSLDSQQRLQSIRDYFSNTTFINFTYGYDDNHNVVSISDSLAPQYNLTLDYDASDRLEVARGQWGNGSFRYDALGNITRQMLGSSTLNYQYSNNRLTSLSGSQSRSFSYDSRGNITHNGLRGFSFNMANQLTASGNLRYVYDGHNRLVKRTSGSSSSYQLYSSNGKLMHEQAADGSRTDYIYLADKLITKVKGTTASYVHSDALGSPRLETNASRSIASNSRQHYQPYGQRIPGSSYTDIGFTGHKHDGELGLTYMQQRYYDPLIGRFYSNDPVGFTANNPMMFNRYAYANNNPYKFVDPDGKEPISFASLFPSSQEKAIFRSSQQYVSDTAKLGGDLAIEAGASAGEYGIANLGNASTVAGLIPGGQVASLALAGADLLLNNDTASTSGAVASGLVGKMATDIASDAGRVNPTNKVQAAIYVVSQAVGIVANEIDTMNQDNSKVEIKDEKQ